MTNAKDQHYVPRAYLAAFTEPNTPSGHEPFFGFMNEIKKNRSRERRRRSLWRGITTPQGSTTGPRRQGLKKS